MGLNEKQWKFTLWVSFLIQYAFAIGLKVRLDDAFAKDGHKIGSFHYKHLAVDLPAFSEDGTYLTETKDYEPLGKFWKNLDPECTWGGDFQDGNHFSYGEH